MTLPAEQITQAVAKVEREFLDLLQELVHIDSGSYDHDGVRAMTARVASVLERDGREVILHDAGEVQLIEARRRSARPGSAGPTILLNAHLDTVFEPGAAAERPFTITDGRAMGPGVCDDKAGVVSAIIAMRVLDDLGIDADVMCLFTPDEEIGWPSSGDLLPTLARQADVALCLEGARADGSLVSARKGGADLRVDITGRAAHSGVEPEKGVHAALQMAHTIIGLQQLNDPASGVTVNVGIARSGTRTNIVPAEAQLQCDIRATTTEAFEEVVERALQAASAVHVPGASVDAQVHFAIGPMEATPGTLALADLAVAVAAEQGLQVRHVATGGIGDANTVSHAGIPVLDGLAPIGGDDHTPEEWLDVSSIVPRLTLLVRLIQRLAGEGVPAP